MTASTCRDCAVRSQVDEIKEMLRNAMEWLDCEGGEGSAYGRLSEAKLLLGTIIDIKKEL